MTQPSLPFITASPEIHNPPPAAPSGAAPLTSQRVGVIGSVLLDLILAQVAIALGNVSVLGQKPFAFLSEWGRELQEKASEAFRNAGYAQQSSNWANAQLSILFGGSLAADVENGVLTSSQFNGASADDIGSGFTLKQSDGPGAGKFGLSGSGRAVWKKSGGGRRRHIYQNTTTLATDYQSILVIIGELPEQTQFLGQDAHTYLVARMNSAGDTFVFMWISWNKIGLGKCVSGDYTFWSDTEQEVELAPGEQLEFIVGTDVNPCQFIIKQSGLVRSTATKTTDYGSGYRFTGVGAQATLKSLGFDQHVPAELEAWAASDRLSSRT